jgi:hypothetical protein
MILKSGFHSGLVLDVPPLYKVVMVVSSLTTLSSMYITKFILIYYIYLISQFSTYRVIYNLSSRSLKTHQSTYQNGRSGRYADNIPWSLGLLPFGYGGRPEDRAIQSLPQVVPPQQVVD